MKNQNDLVIIIVAAVLGLGVTLACFLMKPEPKTPAAPSAVVTTALAYPAATPVMANGLPTGGAGGGGMGGPGGGMGMGGMGRGGPMGGQSLTPPEMSGGRPGGGRPMGGGVTPGRRSID